MPETSDEKIAAAVQGGDTEAFGLLVERYEEKMTRYARKFLFGYEETADLIQEIFLKAYENILSFDPQRKFSPWLYRIAHNEFINAIKKKGWEPLPLFDADVFFPHPAAEAADGETNRQDITKTLDRCLQRLDPKYREPLLLYYFEDLSYQEIAEILRIPMSTVGIRLRRARITLQKICKKEDFKL